MSSRGHSNLVIFNQISSKFHIWVASIKLSFKFKYGFCPMNNNQDGLQNGCRLSVCSCGHSTLVIYYPIASKFHIWITLIKLLPNFENGLFPITKMSPKMATACHFALVDTLTKSFITQFLPNFIYELSPNYCSFLNMGFVWWTIIKFIAKTDIPFSLQGIMRGPLSEFDCSSCIGRRHDITCSGRKCYVTLLCP